MTESSGRKEAQWLRDLQEAIEKIQSHPRFGDGRPAFDSDEYFRVWVYYHIERIGECATHLRQDFSYDQEHPEINWKEIVGMRQHLVHRYWGVLDEIVWKSVSEDLPALKETVDRLVVEKAVDAERQNRPQFKHIDVPLKKEPEKGPEDDCMP